MLYPEVEIGIGSEPRPRVRSGVEDAGFVRALSAESGVRFDGMTLRIIFQFADK
jgi:hypothetical protein